MSDKDTSFDATPRPILCKGKILDFSTPRVMGVLNITPDSFYDGGKYHQEKQWYEQTALMLKEGASIIDLGAISTRPGAEVVSEEEEIDRMALPLELLRKAFPDTLFSIDTYHSKTASICIDLGADIINDISGGRLDTQMFETVAKYRIPYILMHMHGIPSSMQKQPVENNVIVAVSNFFSERVDQLHQLGVQDIILDPGFGFGKTLACNYALLKHMESTRIHNLPLLGGISRKSMINKILNTNPSEALNGTTILNTVALLNGANLLRVHDVKEAMEAIHIVGYYKDFGQCD